MKRRTFVTQGAVAAVSATAISTEVLRPTKKGEHSKKSSGSPDEFELNELTVRELQEKMRMGAYTSEALTILYLHRIEKLDSSGPKLNSVIELNPDALSIAKAMDTERKNGKIRGPLHGIPILIKDNINTADKMMTTAGSLGLVGNVAMDDAFIIKKLREAGAVLLGKTNLSEWANFRSTKSCSGWSSRGGQTRMPFYTDRNPCGSSSGSGVAVSANLCALAIGTETDGSITCPASTNGVVGIKPTVGLWSRTGIIPISFTQDTAGPLTRTVEDAAILLGALAGMDAQDDKTKMSPGHALQDYTPYLDKKGLAGKRIGVDKKKYENQFLNRLQEKAIALIKTQGAEVVDVDYVDKINALGDEEFELLKFEFKDGLNKYLSTSHAPYKTLQALIDYNIQHEDQAMPTFKQEIFLDSEAKEGLDSEEYLNLLEKTHLGSQRIIDEVLTRHHLDGLAGLTMGPACAIDTVYGDRWGDVFLTAPAAMSGYPHICVPAGKVYDLPVGLSFFGTAWQEGPLISMAYAFEQATKHRQKPEFKERFSL